MKLSFEFDVRTYELDAYGHVNNAVYLNYFEYARMKFLTACNFDYNRFLADGFFLYVAKATIEYKHSLVLCDKVTVTVEPKTLGSATATFWETAYNSAGVLCAIGEIKCACVNQITKKPVRIPEKYRVPGLVPNGD